MTQSLIVVKSACVKKETPDQKLFLSEKLAPTPEIKKIVKKEKLEEKTVFIAQNPVPEHAGELSADVLFDMINQHRSQISLPVYQKEPQVCAIAAGRREEIVQEIFVTGQLHAGFWGDNNPFWATENMIWQHSEKLAMNWWLNSPIHRAAIEGDYLYACGTCNGEVCNMIFSSLIPKITRLPEVAIAAEPPKLEGASPTMQAPTPQEAFAKVVDVEKNRFSNAQGIIR